MDRTDCAIVINTCPKYFYILETHFTMLRRYAPKLKWPVYLATESPNEFRISELAHAHNIHILPLDTRDADFFESRVAAIRALPSEIKYVLPIQDDFLLERPGPDGSALKNALEILDTDRDVLSIRLMPCPGSSAREPYWGVWNKLLPQDLQFSYQATIWRREIYMDYMMRLIQQRNEFYPYMDKTKYNQYAVTTNPAETYPGLQLLKLMYPTGVHLCWPRVGAWANAVYQCPWPYRPTAIVKGKLQDWAVELARREGCYLSDGPSMR
jgi:hypothetical protein